MEQEFKLALGKLLGEVYRVQKEQGIYQSTDSRIFGLLNGVEEEIESEFNNLEMITRNQVDIVCDALDPYYKGENSLENMPTFLNFRMKLEQKGITHSMLLDILKYLKAKGSYTLEIEQLGNFEINDYDL